MPPLSAFYFSVSGVLFPSLPLYTLRSLSVTATSASPSSNPNLCFGRSHGKVLKFNVGVETFLRLLAYFILKLMSIRIIIPNETSRPATVYTIVYVVADSRPALEIGKGYSQLLIHSYNFFHVTANNY